MDKVILYADISGNYLIGILKTELAKIVDLPSTYSLTVAGQPFTLSWGQEVTDLSPDEQLILTADYKYRRFTSGLVDAKKLLYLMSVLFDMGLMFPPSVLNTPVLTQITI